MEPSKTCKYLFDAPLLVAGGGNLYICSNIGNP
jgi:hypothetical protein